MLKNMKIKSYVVNLFLPANQKKWSCDSSSKNELNLTIRQTAYLTPLKTPHDLNFVLFCKYENQGLCHDFIFTLKIEKKLSFDITSKNLLNLRSRQKVYLTLLKYPRILKFGFSEKATKFEKIFVVVLTRASCSVRAKA